MPAKQRWTVGAVVLIPLGDERFTYAQMLDAPEYAFFDFQSNEPVAAEEVIQKPVAFRLWVMRYAHSGGRWKKVGTSPVDESLKGKVHRFNQDRLNHKIRLTLDGFEGPLVTAEECEGVECAAVWDPEHIENRLRDHFSGVPNKWVESLRPKSAP